MDREGPLRRAVWVALVAATTSSRMADTYKDNEFTVLWDMTMVPIYEFIHDAVKRADEVWTTQGRDAAIKSLRDDRAIVERTMKWISVKESFDNNMNLALMTVDGYMDHRRWLERGAF